MMVLFFLKRKKAKKMKSVCNHLRKRRIFGCVSAPIDLRHGTANATFRMTQALLGIHFSYCLDSHSLDGDCLPFRKESSATYLKK